MISILVVDDEEGIREYLADALAEEGRTVVQAADGIEALEHLAKQSFERSPQATKEAVEHTIEPRHTAGERPLLAREITGAHSRDLPVAG